MAVTWHLRNPTTFAEQKDDSEGIDAKATGETDNRKGQFGTTGKKHRPSGLVRVNNGLPGQTVKGRGCNTEEEGCFGNAETPDDDHCNPDHVGNFSFSGLPIISRTADDYGQTGNGNSHSDEGEGGEEYCVNAKTFSDI
ncbi:MAG: hypothetical protein ACLVEE_03270 [Phocaeicola vulgatus]